MKREFKNLGKVIKRIRKNKNRTQVEIAKAIQIHPQFISNIERGLCGVPEKNMKKFVKKFGDEHTKNEILFAMIEDAEKAIEQYVEHIFG